MTEAEAEKFFGEMPATWTCCQCKRKFSALPSSPHRPEAVMTQAVQTATAGRYVNRIIGEVCKKCCGGKK